MTAQRSPAEAAALSAAAATATAADAPEPAPELAPAPARKPTLWHNRDFLTFWFGETLSLFGTQITTLALPLAAVLVLNAGPEALGFLRFLQLVPYLLFGPRFGGWVDRHRRRPLMIGATLVRMALIGLIPVVSALGGLSMPLVLAVAFGVGSAAVMFDASWMSFVPSLVREPEYLLEANAKLATTSSAADATGPGVAGSLVSLLTAPTAIAANAVGYLLSVISLLLVRTHEEPPTAPAERRLRAELAEGMRFVVRNRYVRWVAAIGGLANFFTSANSPMFLLYAVRDRHVSSFTLGLMFSIAACGGILGGLLSRRVIQRFRLGRVYMGALILAFVPSLLIPAATGPGWAVDAVFTLVWFAGYLGLSTVNIIIMSLRQTVTPQSMLGRMNAAARAVMFGLGALGGPVAGLVAAEVGVRDVLWVFTSASAVFVVLCVAFSPVSRLKAMSEAVAGSEPAAEPIET